MGKIRDLLGDWTRNFIRTADLAMGLGKTANACYLVIKRALKAGLLIRVRRGLYVIPGKLKQFPLDEFELALLIYGPSFVSCESALSYHGWIPEAVYTTTCVSAKRAREFSNPIGTFTYKRIPEENFYVGVERIATRGRNHSDFRGGSSAESGAVFIASPWRSLADLMYTRRKNWSSINELVVDLRIDRETLMDGDTTLLGLLAKSYPSRRVRDNLNKILKDIADCRGEKTVIMQEAE